MYLDEDEEEEEEEEFFDTLDRISVSDSDPDTPRRRHVAAFSVWTAEPSSIDDRRRKLLHDMGLAGDPSLSRFKPPPAPVQTVAGSPDPEPDRIARLSRTIRDLDTGTEFEVGEDGAQHEVPQLGSSPIVQELMRRQNCEGTTSVMPTAVAGPKRRTRWLEKLKPSESTHHGPEPIKVHQCGKLNKELTGLFMSQEIKAHEGAIWTMKFSLDGKYLASAGEDCVVNVWRVAERGEEMVGSGLECVDRSHLEKKWRMKVRGRKSRSSVDQLVVPEHVFALSEIPLCSFKGHLEDVLDLSWSKTQYLLSSSMDKTVKLWHLSSNSCLRTFSHSDYVTCIQFNPVDDRYFISGSLDEKVRIWSIPDRQVLDWHDLREMVTAVCYNPNGQGALVGSHKGSCHLYNTSGNKLLLERQVDLQNKKKKSGHKKITGFQLAPGSSSEVLVTSADSRIRVIEDNELVHKFKGFRNTNSQISACLTSNGKYLICASEDSRVYVWRYDVSKSRKHKTKSLISVTQSYEHFHCPDLTVAVPWPVSTQLLDNMSDTNSDTDTSEFQGHSFLSTSATWPEEKLMTASKYQSKSVSGRLHVQSWPAWGMVIVTAGKGGQIKTFQNFGFEVQL